MSKLNNKFYVTLILYFLSSVFCFALAGGMEVSPGMWETKSQISTPAGEHENVSQECIKESEITPERMLKDNPGCQITSSHADSSSMKWEFSCSQDGVSMTGDGQVSSSGNAISGGMNMNANFGGQEVTMTTKWEGKRIGDC